MRNLLELSVNEKALLPLKQLIHLFFYGDKSYVADHIFLILKGSSVPNFRELLQQLY